MLLSTIQMPRSAWRNAPKQHASHRSTRVSSASQHLARVMVPRLARSPQPSRLRAAEITARPSSDLITDLSQDAVYLKRALKEGDVVEYPNRSVVVMGDVPKGARVVAGGDIVVLGQLLGEAVAGAGGNKEASVVALKLNPSQLTIGGQTLATPAATPPSGPLLAALNPATSALELQPVFTSALAVEPAESNVLFSRLLSVVVLLLGVALALSPVTVLGALRVSDGSVVGALLDAVVYGYILLTGAGLLSSGSELLLEILNPGIVGGVLLPTLGALPDALIILVSGLGVSRELAQQQVAVGVGTLAGSTILLLSVAFGGSVLLGRTDLNSKGEMIDRKLTRGWDLENTGVSTDEAVPQGAVIMMATTLLYGIVQVPAFLGNSESPTAALIGSIVCLASAVGYCVYQVVSPGVQQRKIEAARMKRLRLLALRSLAASSQQYGGLVGPEGQLNREAADRIFDSFDQDKSGHIDKAELEGLVMGLQLTGSSPLSRESMAVWERELDANQDSTVDRGEFYTALSRWLKERAADTAVLSMSGGTSSMGMLQITAEEQKQLQQTAAALGADELREEVEEEEEERGEPLTRTQIITRATLLMGGGISLCAIFSDPLVEALNSLSEATGIPPFFMGFVLAPLASNSSELVSSLQFATRKKKRTMSLTLSQVYGAVTMNNTFVLGLFLMVVYIQQLDWIYSSEVVTLVAATIAVGLIGSRGPNIKASWGVAALAVYPLSLAAVWGMDTFLGWQ